MPATDFRSVFSDLAERIGDREAILAPDCAPLSFSALRDRLATVKSALNRLGIGHGDRVALALPNGPDAAVCLLGAMSCATAVPLDPASPRSELESALHRLRPRALIVPQRTGSLACAAAQALRIAVIELCPHPAAAAGTFMLQGEAARCADPRWNDGEDIGVILLTSGTTSVPKLVPWRPRQFVAYAHGINMILRLGPGDRSLHVMPLYHGAGLKSSFLVPLLNGAAIVCLGKFEVESFFGHLDRFRPTWLTAGYAFHRAILDGVDAHRDVVSRTRLRFIRSGTGSLDAKVKAGLERAFGAPVIEQYSSTETGVIACEPFPPAPSKPGTVGRAVVNEIAIMGADGALAPTGEEGEVVVRGPSVFHGYLDDDEANRAAFIDGWYRTGDLGRLDEDGFLRLTGRLKEVINRGGKKISPREVEGVLAAHPAVRELKVFGIPHPSLGQEVAAAAVLHEGLDASEAELKAFVGPHLADYKIPRRILFRSALPLGPTKKLDLQGLVREYTALLEAERHAQAAGPCTPLSPTESVIRDLWRAALGTEAVGSDDDFFLLGGDSLKAVEILVAIEQRFGFKLPSEVLYGDGGTVRGLASFLDRMHAVRSEPEPADDGHASLPARRPRTFLNAGDLLTFATFAVLVPVAWSLPRKSWPAFCAGLARLHSFLKGPPNPGLAQALDRLQAPLTPDELQRRFLSSVYEDVLNTLREHLPIVGKAPLRLHGLEHIERASAAGRGAVLWACPSAIGGLVVKRALHAAGVPLVNLRSAIHPYSGTWLGMKLLNPIRTSVEDRYLKGTVIVHEQDGLNAFQALRRHLADNSVVSIAANGAEGTPFELPFLGGTLKLALGAPTLATLEGAPLLPLFESADDKGQFNVEIGAPLTVPAHADIRATSRALAFGYARTLEAHLREQPATWRGWFMRHTYSLEVAQQHVSATPAKGYSPHT